MTLKLATTVKGAPVGLEGTSPYPCDDLFPLVGELFELPCGDPWIFDEDAHARGYLDGAVRAWEEHPGWMDFLSPASPAYELKQAEQDLYKHWWSAYFNPKQMSAMRVLDVGCGIGRFIMPFLNEGASVFGLDPDLQSLRMCVNRAAGRPGKLDLFWTTAKKPPTIEPVDIIIACEVLCYIDEPLKALQALTKLLKPGGVLLISVEARFGWAASSDASAATLKSALTEESIIDLPGEMWTQTYSQEQLTDLLQQAGLQVQTLVPTHYIPDGPLENAAPEGLDLDTLLELEEQCRQHPIWAPLNRIWTAVASKDANSDQPR
jgi:SAM-dependent methyltransferase